MRSNAEIVEQIRRVLDEPEGFSLAHFQRLADEYARACERFNELLALAIRYYATGFYCEAVRIAREENLADDFDRLLFDRAEEWREHCRNLGCEIGPKVSGDNGVTLLSFIVKYERHENLFARNRLLALSNAGAVERLDVLYQLAVAFPENANNWAETIEKLEKRRIQEIRSYLGQLNAQNASLSAIRELLAELESPVRQTAPPEDVLSALRNAGQFLYDRECKEELCELARRWRVAETSRSEKDASRRLEEYRSFLERCGEFKTNEYFNALPEKERDDLTTARRYAEDLERRDNLENEMKRSAFKLEKALDSNSSDAEIAAALERLETAAVAAGRSTTPPVGEEARAYLADRQLKNRRKRLVGIVALALILGVFSVAVVIVSRQTVNQKNALALARDISAALDEYDRTKDANVLASVQKKVDAIKPKYVEITKDKENAQNLEKLQRRYEEASRSEDFRVAEIERLAGEINSSHGKGLANPNAVEELGRLVRSIQEKQEYGRLKKEDAVLTTQIATRAVKSFNEVLEKITREFSEINDDKTIAEDVRLVRTNELKTRLSQFAQSNDRLSPPQRAQLDALAAKIDAYQIARKEIDATKTLIEAVGSIEDYRTALIRVGRRLQGKEDEQIRNALTAVDLVGSVEKWNAFAEKYAKNVLASGVPTGQFEEFASDADSNDAEFKLIPEYVAVEEYCQKKRQAQNDRSIANALEKLSKELANDRFDGRYYQLYHAYNGRYYYLDEEVQYGDDKTVNYYSAKDEKKPFNASFMDMDDVCVPALQYEIYEKVETLRTKSDLTEEDFKTFAVETIREVVDKDPKELDPVVKGILLGKITSALSEVPGFASLKNCSQKINKAIPNVEIDFYYQEEQNYQSAKPEILKVLNETSPELTSKLDALNAEGGDAFSLPTYRWIGFVEFFGESASLELGKDVDQSLDAPLCVAKPGNVMIECGAVDEGKAKIDGLDADFRWFPVYARTDGSRQ